MHTPPLPAPDARFQAIYAAPQKLWITRQVADFLHVSPKTVFELRKKGLPFIKLGGAVRFVPREIEDYLLNSRRLSSHRLRQIARKGSPA